MFSYVMYIEKSRFFYEKEKSELIKYMFFYDICYYVQGVTKSLTTKTFWTPKLRTLYLFPRCQCVYTHQAGRKPALQQNWQSLKK